MIRMYHMVRKGALDCNLSHSFFFWLIPLGGIAVVADDMTSIRNLLFGSIPRGQVHIEFAIVTFFCTMFESSALREPTRHDGEWRLFSITAARNEPIRHALCERVLGTCL